MEYKLSTIAKNLKGVGWESYHPSTTTVFFLPPPISSKGNELRKCMKEVETLETKLKEEKEEAKKEEIVGKTKVKRIECLVLSAKFQYKVEKRESPESKWEETDEMDDWIECLGDHITDTQVVVIINSLYSGEKITMRDLINASTDEKKILLD